jgi:imidazole glycerol-phosphate synthase subunit HisF
MFCPRVIPVLLLRNKGLVKSVGFRDYRYIGDPINAVRIFNDLKADELVFLDILASRERRTISPGFVEKIGEEANMPFAAGGGIRDLKSIKEIISAGAEKVVLNTIAAENPDFVSDAASAFGSSTIVVCIDVKKNLLGREKIRIYGGIRPVSYNVTDYARLMEEKGAGELIIQSVDLDGSMKGYDLALIRKVADSVNIPVVALGGAGSTDDLRKAYVESYANGLAAGSIFLYHGARKGILINYPESKEFLK